MVDLASLLAGEQKRKTFAQMLAQQSAETTPTPSWGAGLARALQGGMAGLIERGEKNASGSEFDKLYGGGSPAPYSPQAMGAALQPSAAPASAPGKIYSNDEPSPLDPPSGQDRTRMIATILGEAGNQPPTGQTAVASVIRNRAVDGGYGGDTPFGVVTAPNQFEPWNTAQGRSKMASALADPNQAAAADRAISAAYGEGGQAPNDPTNGAKNFIAPKAQAALGRAMPGWAQGQGQDIGDHRFFGGAPQEPGQQPYQVAGPATASAQAGQPQAGQTMPRQAPQIPPDVQARARDLWVSGEKAAAAAMLQPYTTPKDQWETVKSPVPGDNNMYQRNSVSNEMKPLNPQPFAVNIDQKAPTKFEETYGEGLGKQALSTLDAGNQASQNIQRINLLKALNEAIGIGKFTESKATIGAYALSVGVDPKLFGIDPNLPANAQTMRALTNEMTLGKIGTGGLPANNFSDADRSFLEKTVPSLSDQPEANAMKLAVAERIAGLQQKKASDWVDARANKISYEQFDRDWRKQMAGQNIFGDLIANIPAKGADATQSQSAPAGAIEEARRRGLIK